MHLLPSHPGRLSVHQAGSGHPLEARTQCLRLADQQRLVSQENQLATLVQSVWPGRDGRRHQGPSRGVQEQVSGRGLGQADSLNGRVVPNEELRTEGGWVRVSLGPGKDTLFCLVLSFLRM